MFQVALLAVGRALWHGFVAVVVALWGNLLIPILDGIGHGLGLLVRALAPWVIGGVVLLYLINYQPEAANALLALAVVFGVFYLGWRILARAHRR